MRVDIEQIDPHNEPALRAWWEVGQRATAQRPGVPWPPWEAARRALSADNPERELTFLAAIHGREMVGAALVNRPVKDNVHTATIDVYVVPERWREGIGSALVGEAERVCAGDRRTTVLGEAYVPTNGTAPCEAFALGHGYEIASREAIKELTMADFVDRREELAVLIRTAADEYRIVTFDTVCPEEYAASFGVLLGSVYDAIPLGELDLADSEWSVERLRAAERRQVGIGRHVLTALAVAADGSVAGASDVRVNDDDSTAGQVGITIVASAHRGHRLGLVLKAATHELALAQFPDLRTVDTSNAEVNTHMNAVNEALGYRSIETLLELQKHLA